MEPETGGKKCRDIGKGRVTYVPQGSGPFLVADGVDVKPVQESLRHSTSKITLDLFAQSTTPNKLTAQRQLIEAIVPKNQVATGSTAV